ncbi:glycosyltransferase [Microbacterium kyungheense]|uniref:Glycosyl transferase family 1 n=1 Tax=Microbacterium kyungheense TaxID=1263636 RepID=A0A543ERY6_9MICO|nr:glycosyltransferase [Microbacterium kyungheense]TQM24279.1 glycosyl transferase family 1 [Microbacterium kyungheense]
MTRRELVVFSLEAWDDVWRRNQYLIDGLLRADPDLHVLMIEPSNDLLHSLLSGRRIRRGRGTRTAREYDGRLTLHQPDKLLPRVLGPAADASLRRSVRRVIRRLGLSEPALWVNDPSWAGFVERSDRPALYDMTDDWLAAHRTAREHHRITINEDTLMARCRAVVVCSAGLQRSRSRQREVVLIPNAVDVERYRVTRSRPADMPGGPTATYIGTLHEDRLDVELLVRTADALGTEGRILLVGPNSLAEANTERLRSHPRIVMLGARPWTDIPAYLQHSEVLLVPHLVNAFTESLDPLKLYEYRAVGRPVVSTAVAGFRDVGAGVAAVSGAVFPSAVAAATYAHLPTQQYDGIPDWADRVAEFADVLADLWGPASE